MVHSRGRSNELERVCHRVSQVVTQFMGDRTSSRWPASACGILWVRTWGRGDRERERERDVCEFLRFAKLRSVAASGGEGICERMECCVAGVVVYSDMAFCFFDFFVLCFVFLCFIYLFLFLNFFVTFRTAVPWWDALCVRNGCCVCRLAKAGGSKRGLRADNLRMVTPFFFVFENVRIDAICGG